MYVCLSRSFLPKLPSHLSQYPAPQILLPLAAMLHSVIYLLDGVANGANKFKASAVAVYSADKANLYTLNTNTDPSDLVIVKRSAGESTTD